MNKIRVIKKSERSLTGLPVETNRPTSKPTKRELVEVVGGWIADWRSRTQIENRRALDACGQFRIGSSLEM